MKFIYYNIDFNRILLFISNLKLLYLNIYENELINLIY